jgi:predicted nucleic acid-binding protein
LRLYLDTSALVKFYVEEDGSTLVRKWIDNAETVATSIIAYVEARAAFARRRRERRISTTAYAAMIRDFEADWDHYLILEATEPLIKRAGKIAEAHALRAYDAIHLASARILKDKLMETVSFASWDERLTFAARKEALDAMAVHER